MRSEALVDPVQENLTQNGPDQEVHLLDLLIVLSKYRKRIALFTISVTILATITVFLLPSRYTAETVVLPPGQNSSMNSALLGQLGGSSALASAAGASLGIKNPGDMYVALFRLRSVEDAVIYRFGLIARYHKKKMTDVRLKFEDRSTVALGVKDGLIRITVTDPDPNMAADIANGYVDEFRKLSAGLAITEASQRRAFFQQQLLEANESLANAEEAMKQTQQTTGVLQVDSQARSLIESAAVLRGQIVAEEVQIQGMRSYATEDNPEVVLAEHQLAALKAQLAKLSGSDVNSNSDIIVPKGNIPQAEMEYLRKLRDLRYRGTVEELIAKQFEVAKLDEARQGAIIQVADVAVPPDKRSFPERTIIIAVAAASGLLLAVGYFLLAEGFKRLRADPLEGQRLEALRATFGRKRF